MIECIAIWHSSDHPNMRDRENAFLGGENQAILPGFCKTDFLVLKCQKENSIFFQWWIGVILAECKICYANTFPGTVKPCLHCLPASTAGTEKTNTAGILPPSQKSHFSFWEFWIIWSFSVPLEFPPLVFRVGLSSAQNHHSILISFVLCISSLLPGFFKRVSILGRHYPHTFALLLSAHPRGIPELSLKSLLCPQISLGFWHSHF